MQLASRGACDRNVQMQVSLIGSAKLVLRAAEPTYGPSGELEDGGADLTMGGMCSYYHDLIYLAAIVQVASIISDRIWWTFLVVSSFLVAPGRAQEPTVH